MKRMLFVVLVTTLSTVLANANDIKSITCSARGGLMNANLTQIKLEKSDGGYTVYLTASSSDTGSQWRLENEKVAENLKCKFSEINFSMICSVGSVAGWNTVRASKSTIEYISDSTGEDKSLTTTDFIISGTSSVLKRFNSSVFKFSATDCEKE